MAPLEARVVSELGVGIIGAGSFGGQHAQALAGLLGVRLVAPRRGRRLG
jgi:hypothetical protein